MNNELKTTEELAEQIKRIFKERVAGYPLLRNEIYGYLANDNDSASLLVEMNKKTGSREATTDVLWQIYNCP